MSRLLNSGIFAFPWLLLAEPRLRDIRCLAQSPYPVDQPRLTTYQKLALMSEDIALLETSKVYLEKEECIFFSLLLFHVLQKKMPT